MLLATCSRTARRVAAGSALVAAGLGWSGFAAAQSSVWDRGVAQTPQVPYRRDVYEHRPDNRSHVPEWDQVRSSWTPVDASGRSKAPIRYETPREPAPAPVTHPIYQRVEAVAPAPVLPAPAAAIRSSLESLRRPAVTASSVLRGSTVYYPVSEPAAEPAVSARRSSLWDDGAVNIRQIAGPPIDSITPAVAPPFPEQEARQASLQEEPTFSLFELPDESGPWYRGDHLGATWENQYAGVAGVSANSSQPLLAPEVGADDEPPMLDGLDAVQGQAGPSRNPYEPIPLSAIKPYRSYTPQGIELCPSPQARCPEVKDLPESMNPPQRPFAHLDFLWVPSNVFYSPLYFEDPALERSGHSHGPLLQPVASATRFAAQLVSLPYQIALDPPHRRVYPLGFYRPGECAPKQVPNVPLNARAAAAAGAVYTGGAFIFP